MGLADTFGSSKAILWNNTAWKFWRRTQRTNQFLESLMLLRRVLLLEEVSRFADDFMNNGIKLFDG